MTECECSEEYGPCEDHGIVIVQRDGAAVRCADELAAVMVEDLSEIIRDHWDGRTIPSDTARALAEAETIAADYWEATDHRGGWWVDGEVNDALASEALYEYGVALASHLPGSLTLWEEDGYRVIEITGGPLA